MKPDSYTLMRTLALCACIIASGAVCATAARAASGLNNSQDTTSTSNSQPQAADKKDAKPTISEGEEKLVKKINAAPDTAAKLQATEELLKKYPKTTLRAQIADYLSGQIANVQDAGQRITLSENLLRLFPTEAADLANPILINSYIVNNRPADAFRVAAPWLEKNSSDVGVLINLANTGVLQANKKDMQFAVQSRQYAVKAIELIEADKKPAMMDAAQWNANKQVWLGQLYQSVGFLALLAGDKAEGVEKLQKAITLNPTNPSNYAIIGNVKNDEYQQIATQYKSMSPGAEQDAMLKKAYATLDEIIDLYAHAVAMSEGNAQLQQFHDTLYNDLKGYYAYRHSNSTDGLQQLIDKYKTPSKP